MPKLSLSTLKEAANKFNQQKYAEEFYIYHLKVLRDVLEVNESLSHAVKYLLLWKLGEIRSKSTPKSYPLEIKGLKGHRYYAIPTTKANDLAINKAIEEERLSAAISFRNKVLPYDQFKGGRR